ncbi:MAG: hypothetical protein ABIB46_00270 [bacterium]
MSIQSEPLGKIEKPQVADYEKGKKLLYFIPLIFIPQNASSDFLELLNKYWNEINTQITNLETKLGKVNKIYHELIPEEENEKKINAIKEINPQGFEMIKSRLDQGVQLQTIENKDLLTEFMDWGKCLTTRLQNQKVLNQIYAFYIEVQKKRNDYILQKITETLKETEKGILIMGEGYQIQFPEEIEIFYIAPPSLDEFKHLIRKHQEAKK